MRQVVSTGARRNVKLPPDGDRIGAPAASPSGIASGVIVVDTGAVGR